MKFLPLLTNLRLKKNRSVLYSLVDSAESARVGLFDTGALTSAISEADVQKF